MVVSSAILSSVQENWRNIDVNCGLLSVTILNGILKFNIQCSTNIVVNAVETVHLVGVAVVIFEYQCVISTMNYLQDIVFCNGSSMSMRTYSGSEESKNTKSFRCSLLVWRFCAQEQQPLTVT